MGRTSDAKQRLLDVATELIWLQSYGAVSVDTLCNKAGVKKGSFYHFFPSKSELTAAAFEEHWRTLRPKLDEVFSPLTPPLERLERYCARLYENQCDKKRITGRVLGCPFSSVGAELSAQDEMIRLKADEMFQRFCKYFEAALRDAHAQGQIPAQDFQATARALHCYLLGNLMHARIRNDVELLKNLFPRLLRLVDSEAMAAA